MQPQILHDFPDFFVINKPPGMATEPPSPHSTLRDWLIEKKYINPNDWESGDRYGVIHRLDTDTSGIMIWAKTKVAQDSFRKLWQGRVVKKTYLALVAGKTEQRGVIEYALERDNRNDRQRVALLPSQKSRTAITEYETIASATIGGQEVSLVSFHPITGRTHQIRVHTKAISHPLIADSLYGEKVSTEIAEYLGLRRQFLHAYSLEIPGHPPFSAPIPIDLQQALEKLSIDQALYTKGKIR